MTKKILVAIDGSPASDHAAEQARLLFGDDAEFLAVSVVANPVAMMGPGLGFGAVYAYSPMTSEPMLDAAKSDAEALAVQAMDQGGIDGAEVITEVGDPTEMILDAAEVHHADVIVVAATEKGWFSRLVVGSVADAVVRRAHVPVLVVH